jgi:hypothetical protein|tara:strand:+ start:181 stop:393 length:213 start_codon:yes stop_codon:yes gene_type:complete
MWYDAEGYSGISKDGDVYYGVVSKMELPCQNCPNENSCAEKVLECSAFKSWATTGSYDSHKVGKLLKSAL